MMIKDDFETFLNGLGRALEKLPAVRQMAFSAACCERHFADYSAFHREELWGDPEVLRTALNGAWTLVAGESQKLATRDLLARCMNAIPHSEDFSTPEADYAQDLAIMIAHLVEFMIENDVKYVVMTASLARDLVDEKIQITEGMKDTEPELEQKIARHPLMRAELAFQRRALALLGRITGPDELKAFRGLVLQGLAQ